jgi:hypothetical protein
VRHHPATLFGAALKNRHLLRVPIRPGILGRVVDRDPRFQPAESTPTQNRRTQLRGSEQKEPFAQIQCIGANFSTALLNHPQQLISVGFEGRLPSLAPHKLSEQEKIMILSKMVTQAFQTVGPARQRG